MRAYYSTTRRTRDGTDRPTDGDVDDEVTSGSRVDGFSELETNRVGSSASCAKRIFTDTRFSLVVDKFLRTTDRGIWTTLRVTIDTASLDFRDLTGKLR